MSQSGSKRVVCVMVTCERGAMAQQAVACFRAQSYADKRLLILDSSVHSDPTLPYGQLDATTVWTPDMNGKTIGELRNAANWCAADWGAADIIAHLDSDDISHPNRIAEQIQLLQSSGADVVGYNEMLFWRELNCCHWCSNEAGKTIYRNSPDGFCQECGKDLQESGEAWLYSNKNPHYALGASLCYWRHVWERKPFESTSQGEDEKFIRGLKVAAVSSIPADRPLIVPTPVIQLAHDKEPRMIARIHGTNTSTAYSPRKMEAAREWRRVAEWDKYCQGVFV